MPTVQGRPVGEVGHERLTGILPLVCGETHVLLGAAPGVWSLSTAYLSPSNTVYFQEVTVGTAKRAPCLVSSKCFCIASCSDPSKCGWTVTCKLCSVL